MGILHDLNNGWTVETRTQSVVFFGPEGEKTFFTGEGGMCNSFETDYDHLDNLQKAVEFAQKVRRDRSEGK